MLLRTENYTLKKKVNSLGNKVPNATTLIHINQCNADKQHRSKTEDVENKITDTSSLVAITVLNADISEV